MLADTPQKSDVYLYESGDILIHKRSRQIWSPGRCHRMFGQVRGDGRILVHQIPVDVMLHHIAGGIPPIVKDLAAQNVPTYAPYQFIPLFPQPIVS